MAWIPIRKLSELELVAADADAIAILAVNDDRQTPEIAAWNEIENRLENWGGLSQIERGAKEWLAQEWAAALQKRFGDTRAERIDMYTGNLVAWDGPPDDKW